MSLIESGVPKSDSWRYTMQRRWNDVAADFDTLTPGDFAPGESGLQRLNSLCEEALAINDASICAPVLFRTMERLDEVDEVDLGAPGPLVHTLETWTGGYEPMLFESVRRKPTSLSVWMVNRILNARPPDSDAWIALLEATTRHPSASKTTKLASQDFIDFQKKKSVTGSGRSIKEAQ